MIARREQEMDEKKKKEGTMEAEAFLHIFTLDSLMYCCLCYQSLFPT